MIASFTEENKIYGEMRNTTSSKLIGLWFLNMLWINSSALQENRQSQHIGD